MSDFPAHCQPQTLLAQALGVKDSATGGVVPPIHLATTYARSEDRPQTRYIRNDEPTAMVAANMLARLEGGTGCLLYASGMAACIAPVLALGAGAHVVYPRQMYWSLRNWITGFAADWGVGLGWYDAGDLASLQAALIPGKTKLVWVETPANPLWVVTDIAAAAELAHAAGALLAVDNTVGTPLLTRPLALGADFSIHAATKGLNGHSDVLAGAVIGARDDALWQKLFAQHRAHGAMLGPFEAWLLARGMRTLHLRVAAASQSALAIAQHFTHHPAVHQVLYPGLPDHPGHAIAARQMQGGFGSMLSLRLAGGAQAAALMVTRTRLFHNATSLGGVDSLIEHRGPVEGPTSPVPDDLLRVSVGIEATEDLIDDLEQALKMR